jgi:ADP-ribosylglycohydrolase
MIIQMNKILGNLIGAAAGDAMGAATEMRTKGQILQTFGGYVRDFYAPPDDTYARGNKRGQVTDDFSLAFETCLAIVKNQGVVDKQTAVNALFSWAREENYYYRFAGPTTKASIERLMTGQPNNPDGFIVCNDNSKATNGAAMKISPIALFSQGNIDIAINDAVTVASLTHPNNISISGACAIAAATSAALKQNASLKDVIDAGIFGAERGNRIGEEKFATLAGPSIGKRIKLAVDIAIQSDNMDHALEEIGDYIGSGLLAAEAVPAVFGIIVAANGDPLESIFGAVNIGYDTDTVATMVGGIVGALHGAEAFPHEYLEILNEANRFDLLYLAKEIQSLYE